MKFQKFYVYFCSFLWIAWALSILLIKFYGYPKTHMDIIFLITFIPYILTLIPVCPIFCIVALVKSIKIKKKAYIIFNVISTIPTLILGFLNFVYCAVYYSGGA